MVAVAADHGFVCIGLLNARLSACTVCLVVESVMDPMGA